MRTCEELAALRGPGTRQAALAEAAVAAVAYSDLFDCPLTVVEITRFLPGIAAAPEEVAAALAGELGPGRRLTCLDGLIALRGREATVAVRRRRQALSAALWPAALRHARRIGRLPFVRLVAITGALAVDNADDGADIDLLVVAARRRVWTVRALVMALARATAGGGARLCPNLLLGEEALALAGHDLYAARDLVQMVPVVGRETYRALRAANPWADELLPNAAGAAHDYTPAAEARGAVRRTCEALLGGGAGDALERALARSQRAHLERKIARGALPRGEARWEADAFCGHFDGHRTRVLARYAARLAELAEVSR